MELEMVNISKEFEDKYALKDISLKVKSGKIISVIGPSGAGKTTLLRIINMLDLPSNGVLKIDGKNPVRRRKPRYF